MSKKRETRRHPLRLLILGVDPEMGEREGARWLAYTAGADRGRRLELRHHIVHCGYPVEVFDAVAADIDEMDAAMRGRAA